MTPDPAGTERLRSTDVGAESPAGAPSVEASDAARHRARGAAPARHGGFGGWLRETAIIVVSALALSLLIKTFLIQAFFIPSGSMQDTLLVGDRVLVTKLAPGPFDVNRGDIVVFKDPGGWLPATAQDEKSPLRRGLDATLTFVGLLPHDSGEHLIKRVIGTPGDSVECCDADGRVMVNGVPLDEPYLADGSVPSELEFSVTVPEGGVWVMGDNRQNSQDSRYQQGRPGGGAVPLSHVVGVAFVTVWPADRWALLRNPGSTFAQVPAAGGAQ